MLVTSGLVANWEADNWTGGNVWTDSVNNLSLTFTGTPTSKTDDGIEIPSSITFSSYIASLGLSYPCTFEWIGRIDGSWSSSKPANIFGLSNRNAYWGGICCYSKTSPNGIQLDIGSSGTVISGMAGNNIYQIVITVDSSGTTRLYVNDTTLKGSTTKSSGYGSKTYLYNNEGSGRFYGAIKSMRLWNKCLSSSELTTLFTPETNGTNLFIKKNNGWIEVSQIFEKQNGVWIEISKENINKDKKYKIMIN